jgi:histone-lysine N-methyltransferase SETMAR
LFIDYLEKGKTITGEYYSNLLTRLDEKIREKRPGLQKKKIIFHQDNAPAHRSVLAMGKLRDLHYELLEHPPYSPDLAPSDFCLFPKPKLFLAGQRFSSNQEATAAVERYFADLTKNHYRDGIMALEHRWNKCIILKGDYVEK